MKKLHFLLAVLMSLSLSSCGPAGGSTGREAYKSQGERIEDSKIVVFIRQKFRSDPLIPNDLIHRAVDRGIVQLSGFVRTQQEADLAILNVRNTPEVKDVINSLVILSSAEYAATRSTAERYSTAR